MRVEGHSSPRFLREGDRTKCGGGAYSLLPVTLQATFLDLFGCQESLLVLREEADALVVLLEELDRAHWVPVGLATRDSDVEDPPQKGQSPTDGGRRALLCSLGQVARDVPRGDRSARSA